MKLYVTRHGETPMNAAHRVCGLTNIDLTEKGIAQAKEAGRSLQDKGIKRIIASPLLRAQHTARLIADEIDIDTIETEQRLIEQNYGIYENTDWDGEAFNANKTTPPSSFQTAASWSLICKKSISAKPRCFLLYASVAVPCCGSCSRLMQRSSHLPRK